MGIMELTSDDPLLCNVFLEALAEVDLTAIFSHSAIVNEQEVRVVAVQHHVRALRCRDRMVWRHNLNNIC